MNSAVVAEMYSQLADCYERNDGARAVLILGRLDDVSLEDRADGWMRVSEAERRIMLENWEATNMQPATFGRDPATGTFVRPDV